MYYFPWPRGVFFWVLLSTAMDLAMGYWLMGANNVLTTQRIDPVVNPGKVGPHVHDVLGGSNFGFTLSTASLRLSQCSSIPIAEDNSNYWYPKLYFWWANGSFTSVVGNPVIYYLFAPEPGTTTAFPDDFRMLSGDPSLRTFDPSSFAQQAITYLCLDFEGKSERYNELPKRRCPSGIRSQINFPSCWNGKDVDSPNHQSHVSFLSTGPDSGTCNDTAYPVTLPRIFLGVYWYTQAFDDFRNKAMVPNQPFVFSNGDPIGYSLHADFYNGWHPGILQRALDECNCDPYGDPACCVAKGLFNMNQTKKCFITDTLLEQTSGTLAALPGANPVQKNCFELFTDPVTPAILSPVYIHNGTGPTLSGTVTTPVQTSRATKEKPKGTCVANSASSPGHRIELCPFSVCTLGAVLFLIFIY
ncbi:hypothetical protein DFP72DRAFT_535796 [Ephemerocybe angulata]|uniref:DUF1996 domain-containing protein n=1 Tax=Ephemerocybe angulata TaxID=980116 RepID=A0A8H6HNI5_9AGAR|nr:hypothetical protein DFP72DRAFT_535796 [Tulosesus angulatus]